MNLAQNEYLLVRWRWFWGNFSSSSTTSLQHPSSKTASSVPGNFVLFLTIIVVPGINWNLSDNAFLCHIIHGLAYCVFVSGRIYRPFERLSPGSASGSQRFQTPGQPFTDAQLRGSQSTTTTSQTFTEPHYSQSEIILASFNTNC